MAHIRTVSHRRGSDLACTRSRARPTSTTSWLLYDGSAAARRALAEAASLTAEHETAEALGRDLVLVPARGLRPERLARGCRRAGYARVIAVRAA